ncbi:MAG: lysylphosphatidylglycerol synthase domain-containing protein [Jiangellaceae bacterium]
MSRLVQLARVAVALLIVAAIAYAVVSEWDDVRHALRTLSWPSVLLAFVAVVAGMVAAVLAWRALLAEEGHLLPPWTAARIFLVGQLGKYLPGSFWSVVLQMELARGAGVPRARAFTTSLAWVGLSVSSALTIGLVGLPVLASLDSPVGWTLIAILPVALACTHPRVLTALVNLILRLLRKPPLPRRFTWRGVGTAFGWFLVTWVCYGAHMWLLANALGAPGWEGFVRSLGGFALALSAGALFFVAPSGAGVREGLIVAALAGVMTEGEALGIAVVSRMLFTVADVLAAGVAALSATRLLGRRGADPVPDEPVSAERDVP